LQKRIILIYFATYYNYDMRRVGEVLLQLKLNMLEFSTFKRNLLYRL